MGFRYGRERHWTRSGIWRTEQYGKPLLPKALRVLNLGELQIFNGEIGKGMGEFSKAMVESCLGSVILHGNLNFGGRGKTIKIDESMFATNASTTADWSVKARGFEFSNFSPASFSTSH